MLSWLPEYAYGHSVNGLVHRSLFNALKFGDDGQTDEDAQRLTKTAQAISDAERRAMAAERETIDRLIAMHLAERIGATFDGRISGVTRSGLFVRLKDTGADGFIPISTLGREFFNHAEEAHALIGSRSGEMYQLGDIVSVKLIEAIPAAGALRFEMVSDGKRRANSGVSKVPVRQLPRNKRGRR